MRLRNKVALLFSSAVFGSTLAIAMPQTSQAIHAQTQTNQKVATTVADGTYTFPVKYQKSGTTEPSTMANFMGKKVTAKIVGGQATLTIPSANAASAEMLKVFKVADHPAVKNGTNWQVTLPANALKNVLNGYVEVSTTVGGAPFKEKQPVDIKFDITTALKPVAPAKPKSDPKKAEPKKTPAKKAAKKTTKKATKKNTKKVAKKSTKKVTKKNPKKTSKKKVSKKTTKKQAAKKNKSAKKDSAAAQAAVTYKAHYLKKGTNSKSTMAQYMTASARMYKKNGIQYAVLRANKPASANMIKAITLNGHGGVRHGNEFYFNLGRSNLDQRNNFTLNGKVSVSTNLPGIGHFTENPEYSVRFTNRHVNKSANDTNINVPAVSDHTGATSVGSTSGTTTNPTSGTAANSAMTATTGTATSAVSTSKDSYYNYAAAFLKQGTSQTSVMQNYMMNAAHVVIKGNSATVTIFANSSKSANMITHMTLGGQTVARSGNGYTVTVAKSALSSIIAGHVDVDVPGVIHESQPFSLRLTPGFSGAPSATSGSSDVDATSATGDASAMGAMSGDTDATMAGTGITGTADAFPMGAASNLNAANQDSIAQAKQAAKNNKQNNKDNQNNNNLNNPDVQQQAQDKEKSDMNNTFLSIGGVISAVLGYIGTTLGWTIFKG